MSTPRSPRTVAVLFAILATVFCLPLHGTPAASPREALTARCLTLLERDARLLADTAAGRLDALLLPLFSGYHDRIGEFAAWAFQWRTSYALVRRGAFTLATLPLAEPPRARRLGAAWDDLIVAKFDELVLQPAGGLPAVRSLHDRWTEELRVAFDAVTADTLRTAALLHGRAMPRRTWRTAADPTPWTGDPPLYEAVKAASGPLKTRMIRPLLTRLTFRAPIAAAVTAAGESLGALGGFGDVALLGGAGELVPLVAAFLGIDYLLSRIDAAANQEALEQELRRGLEAQYDILRTTWLAAAQREIDRRLEEELRVLLVTAQRPSAPASTAAGMVPPVPRP